LQTTYIANDVPINLSSHTTGGIATHYAQKSGEKVYRIFTEPQATQLKTEADRLIEVQPMTMFGQLNSIDYQ
jgi:hypothetical protein